MLALGVNGVLTFGKWCVGYEVNSVLALGLVVFYP